MARRTIDPNGKKKEFKTLSISGTPAEIEAIKNLAEEKQMSVSRLVIDTMMVIDTMIGEKEIYTFSIKNFESNFIFFCSNEVEQIYSRNFSNDEFADFDFDEKIDYVYEQILEDLSKEKFSDSDKQEIKELLEFKLR